PRYLAPRRAFVFELSPGPVDDCPRVAEGRWQHLCSNWGRKSAPGSGNSRRSLWLPKFRSVYRRQEKEDATAGNIPIHDVRLPTVVCKVSRSVEVSQTLPRA